MKKILVFILALIMMMSLSACGGEEISDAGLEGKTLIEVGKEYTTSLGNTFKVNKVELTDEANAHFHLYITYNNNSSEANPMVVGEIVGNVNGEDVQLSGHYDGTWAFGNSSTEVTIDANNTWDEEYSFDKVKVDSQKNGILWFPIDETNYYIEMKTFLEA